MTMCERHRKITETIDLVKRGPSYAAIQDGLFLGVKEPDCLEFCGDEATLLSELLGEPMDMCGAGGCRVPCLTFLPYEAQEVAQTILDHGGKVGFLEITDGTPWERVQN